MSRNRFPARREDGTASVAARFLTAADADAVRVETFVAGWLRGIGRYADLSQDLTSQPRVVRNGEFTDIIFDSKPQGRFWKDWMVFLTRDVAESFPEIRHVSFFDLVADRPHPNIPDRGATEPEGP
jgi:hypothetical protein